MIPLDSFVGQSADGKMVPIIPGGNSIPLTFSNRKEYVERAIEYRLHELDRQVGVCVCVCYIWKCYHNKVLWLNFIIYTI